jgi:tRNA(Arg) A34 adenosine deaminase TadA
MGCIAMAALLIARLPYVHCYSPSSEKELPTALILRLKHLGMESLRSNDVPVASILLYGDSIVGEGFNTVLRDNNAGGHAEINAISHAMHRIGLTSFSRLNRDSLALVSTFEPCTMCMGAMLEYRIKHVRFLKPKPFLYLLQEELRSIRYRWRWQKVGPETLQDSLFFSHPGYRAMERSR